METQPAIHYIYVLTDPETGEARYVGKTKNPNTRLRHHIEAARRGGQTWVLRWIRTVLERGLSPIYTPIEIVIDGDWASREMFWIAHYRRMGCKLTNLTDGGEGTEGWTPSIEWRANNGQIFKALWQDPEYREKAIAPRRLPADRWSRDHDACIDCGRTDRPYAGKGWCSTCYNKHRNRARHPERGYHEWSLDHAACVECGTTERPHGSRGMCEPCYARYRRIHMSS